MKNQQGYIALTTTLFLSAVVILITMSVSLLAIGQAQSSLALFNGENTLTFVEGCMEDALLNVQSNTSYTGGTITRPEGTCFITVSKNGITWTITAATTATMYKRTIQVVVARGSVLSIQSWKEI